MKIYFASVLLVLSLWAVSGHVVDQYCLPMPPNGNCPVGWSKGYRKHDCEDSSNRNSRSGTVPYVAEFGSDIKWGFCCHTAHYGATKITWPKGKYCIFRKAGRCPNGFSPGSLYWDDEDSSNRNSFSGTLPDGIYDANTKIYVCCRNDNVQCLVLKGLPMCKELVLMRYKGSCPHVAGYQGPDTGYIVWDTEDTGNQDKRIGAYPDGSQNFGIDFCTYKSAGNC